MASGPVHRRHVLGIPLTRQVIALIVTAMGLTLLTAFAILSWLESTT